MINLLPPDIKHNLSYAKKNDQLRHWCMGLVITGIGTTLVLLFGIFYIQQSTNNYSKQIEITKTDLETQKLPETQKKVEEISSTLKLTVSVLSREILFSKLLKQIGAAIPQYASLTGLSISKVSGGIDLTAVASDYNTATQVQVNLQDPANKIFDKADIISINCSSADASDPRYPCTVSIRAQFSAKNPFLLINSAKTLGAKS
jgi:Tfp pilus assembly protein PilN